MKFENENWAQFKGETWKKEINVRDFIQNNYKPYNGDDTFLVPSSEKTKKVWNKLTEMFKVEREKGVYDAETKLPQGIDTYGPGYIDKENEVIVGLQTDAPLKRGIFPKGGIRMVENSLEAYGYHLDPMTKEIFTKYRKTHNEGVFSAYTDEMIAARRSAIITGLPDAYGRGRIIGDYRRVPLYGTQILIEEKKRFQKRLDIQELTEEIIQSREEITEQIKALKAFEKMCAGYGFDVTRPAKDAREAVQFLYLAYLAAVKDQDGAAMSLGRTSTFLDIYIEKDICEGKLTEEEAQELIDQFIIKLRIVRFLYHSSTPQDWKNDIRVCFPFLFSSLLLFHIFWLDLTSYSFSSPQSIFCKQKGTMCITQSSLPYKSYSYLGHLFLLSGNSGNTLCGSL